MQSDPVPDMSADCLTPFKADVVNCKEKGEDSWLQEHRQQEKIAVREEIKN